LGGDAGVIGSRLPEDVASAFALESDQHILQRMIERMAHMQAAGYIRRWHHDAEGRSG
jgi:hypothetical protein